MIFKKHPTMQVMTVEVEPRGDERGYFGRVYCQKEFAAQHITFDPVQMNRSLSKHKGTLRGLHYQIQPHSEAKLVSCLRGSIFDVAVDIDPKSPTYLHWHAEVLTEDNGKMLYVPENHAHGFLTLEDNCLVEYAVSNFYKPEAERGLRWNDPKIGVKWPDKPSVISDKDAQLPLL